MSFGSRTGQIAWRFSQLDCLVATVVPKGTADGSANALASPGGLPLGSQRRWACRPT
jgi:hypothetical protein